MLNTLKVAVACYGGAGPLLVPVLVECSDADRADGSHYVAAESVVKQNGYDGPMVSFDETDHEKVVATLEPQRWENAYKANV